MAHRKAAISRRSRPRRRAAFAHGAEAAIASAQTGLRLPGDVTHRLGRPFQPRSQASERRHSRPSLTLSRSRRKSASRSQTAINPPPYDQITATPRRPSARRPCFTEADNFLTSRPTACYRFSEHETRPARPFQGVGGARYWVRNENGVKPLKTNDPEKWPVSRG